jgi:uncharacterized coiled-coil protein SlyX
MTVTKTLEQEKNAFKPLGEVSNTTNHTEIIEVSKQELEFDRIEDIHEASDYLRRVIDDHDTFQFVTKSRLIRMYAEKYKKLGFPIMEIIDEICKQLGNRVERHYVSKILPIEYKIPDKVKAGKISREKNKNKPKIIDTVEELEEQTQTTDWKSDGGDADFEQPNQPITTATQSYVNNDEQIQELQDKIISLEAIIAEQKQQILALNGTIRYSDSIYFEKWHKMDKAMSLKLDTVNKSATSEIYVLVDIRDGHIIKAITDKEYDKMVKNKNKN